MGSKDQKSALQEANENLVIPTTLEQTLPADSLPCLHEAISFVRKFDGIQKRLDQIVGSPAHVHGFCRNSILLWILRDEPSFSHAIKAAVEHISLGKPIPGALDAELVCAALLKVRGVKSISRLEETNANRTPDILAHFANLSDVSVEVTRATEKFEYLAARKWAAEFCDKLHEKTRVDDVQFHYIRQPNEGDELKILDALSGLEAGRFLDTPDAWRLSLIENTREPGVLYVAGEASDGLPEWWPTGYVTSFVFKSSVGPIETGKKYPRTSIVFGIPIQRYLNSVIAKAERPQAPAGERYLVALDVTNLPGAFGELRRGLNEYFKIWPHVLGVLAFQSNLRFPMNEFVWMCEYFHNALSGHDAPDILAPLISDKSAYDVKLFLTESARKKADFHTQKEL